MDADVLFEVEESLSTKEAWVRKHGIREIKRQDGKHIAMAQGPSHVMRVVADTRDDALQDLAELMKSRGAAKPWWIQ